MYEESSSKSFDLYCLPQAHCQTSILIPYQNLICCLVSAVNQCGGGGDALWASGTPCSSHRIVPTLRRFLLSNGPYSNWTIPSWRPRTVFHSTLPSLVFLSPQEMLLLIINYIWVPGFCRLWEMTAVYQHLDLNFSLLLFPIIKS